MGNYMVLKDGKFYRSFHATYNGAAMDIFTADLRKCRGKGDKCKLTLVRIMSNVEIEGK